MSALRVVINGAQGRMGQVLLACIEEDPGLELAAALDAGDELSEALDRADAVVDFSHASATASVARLCAEAGRTLVIGTTGQDASGRQAVAEAAAKIPVVFAPNFSVGVNALFWLARRAAEILGPDFDLEVLEMHHRFKHDAPSGTARRLVEILAEARGWDAEADARHGRVGMPGERPRREIGVHALRGGDVVGDHTVVFATQGERVELSHKASSRETFARGALRAARWAHGRPPGLYDMQDVLGLKEG
ncbi:MAG: 4-hydroxy-tetrahydrodipicolinate reductase, partial [Terrimicrobiaceae bacterium]|nr:4-hydroxy-tetrahydrodipicolinate reductase [Terrimicrobiaceae bacterium]